jgi:hypothetical protein
MRFLSAGIGIVALAAVGWMFWQATEDSREWRELLSWDGRPQEKIPEKDWQRVNVLLQKRLKLDKDERVEGARILVLNAPGGEQRVLVVQASFDFGIRVANELSITVFDGNRRFLERTSSSAGWRLVMDEVKGLPEIREIPWCFEVRVSDYGGPDVHREIYALRDGRSVLLAQNIYEYPNQTIGPEVPRRTPEQWARMLSSTDLREILEALIWLGGQHRTLLPSDPTVLYEDLGRAETFLATRTFPGVKTRLQELTRHSGSWVAEAARAALDAEVK